jgi:hypothetical protein
MEAIVGMDDKEALALIEELMRHATQKKYEYRHKWRHGDWVLWDNRSVMHQANPDYDMRERRYLYRLMLKGETPVRRKSERFDAGELDHLGPLLGVVGNELAERGGRAGRERTTQLDQPRFDLRIG